MLHIPKITPENDVSRRVTCDGGIAQMVSIAFKFLCLLFFPLWGPFPRPGRQTLKCLQRKGSKRNPNPVGAARCYGLEGLWRLLRPKMALAAPAAGRFFLGAAQPLTYRFAEDSCWANHSRGPGFVRIFRVRASLFEVFLRP